jgi:hypothetical protein
LHKDTDAGILINHRDCADNGAARFELACESLTESACRADVRPIEEPMAIPIKCRGCQAAFEVPETLTGKTIRCTSCKTELTVPAAAPVAKVAAPAAKPVAKAALSLDDEKKTRPIKSVAKPASRRRDDDDEDDDDDDDRPAKRQGKGKKAKSGGNGGMIALIVGGVIGICAIGGVIAYVAMGSSDKKESAKSDSSSSPSSSSTPSMPAGGMPPSAGAPSGATPVGGSSGIPAPAMPNSGTGGPGLPGGGNEAVPSGWQRIQGDGFTINMPGQPREGSIQSDGANIKTYELETADSKSGYAVLCVDLPAQGRQVDGRIILGAMLDNMGKKKAAGPGGPSPRGGAGGPRGGRGSARAPGAPGGPGGRWGSRFGSGDGATTGTVKNRRDTTLDGFPATDFEFDTTEIKLIGKGVVGNGKIVLALAGHETDPEFKTNDGAKFIGSLRMGGGAVASGPGLPGGPGGYGTPGMGPGGPPPGYPRPGGMGPGGPPAGYPQPGATGPGGPPPGYPQPGQAPPSSGLPGQAPPSNFGPPGASGIPGQVPPASGIPGQAPPASGIPGQAPPSNFGPPGASGIPGQVPPASGVPGQVPPSNFGPPGSGIPGGAPNFGQPPGIPGGPGGAFPGAGAVNDRPPPGAAVRPRLAHKIQPFYAFAFDSEMKEFYTVSTRIDPKTPSYVHGRLRRYSYPDCELKGEYQLPYAATRAVVDGKKGVLYLAAARNQSSNALQKLWSEGFDRAVAYGDVQVFDLEAIRSGKVKEEADLKAAATLPIAGMIRGLELSNDNKFLLVGCSRTVNGKLKSYVRQYDTVQRKMVKEVPLPEDALDLRKSADGTKLLITGDGSGGKADSVRIMVCDPVTMELGSPVRAPGVVTDIAPLPDGGMVLATSAEVGPAASTQKGQLHSIDAKGKSQEVVGTGWLASHNNYVEFTPDGKHLLVSSIAGHDQKGKMINPGLDVYVPDEKGDGGFKKLASIRSAIWVNTGELVGGFFHIAPDGSQVIFHNGIVLTLDTIAENAENADAVAEPERGGAAADGFRGPGGGPQGGVFPGGVPNGGFPGAPGGALPGGALPGGALPGGVPPAGARPGLGRGGAGRPGLNRPPM